MATDFQLGNCINEPPVFNGYDYDLWRFRIEFFIKSIDIDLWYAIEDGPYRALVTKNDKIREKAKNELNEDDRRMLGKNVYAMSILWKALKDDDLKKVKSCKSAQEILNRLDDMYKSTNLSCDEEKDCSTSSFKEEDVQSSSSEEEEEEEDIDDVMIEKLVKSLYQKLKRANELNESLKEQLEECTLEKTKFEKENEKLHLIIDEFKDSQKELKESNEETKKENERLKRKIRVLESLKDEHVTIRKRMDDLSLSLKDLSCKKEKCESTKTKKGKTRAKKKNTTKSSSDCKKSFYKCESSYSPNLTCNFCGKIGHKINTCYKKREIEKGVQMIWIKKENSCAKKKNNVKRVPLGFTNKNVEKDILSNVNNKIIHFKGNRNFLYGVSMHNFRKIVNDLCCEISKSSSYDNQNVMCNYYMKKDCYVEKLGMKSSWVQSHSTNSIGPNKVWVPKVVS